MARASAGLELKRNQAARIVQSKQKDAVHNHIGQYLLLWSYFRHLKTCDPDGSFALESEQCEYEVMGMNQFSRCYAAFSFAKRVWKHACPNIIVADGTFTTSGVFRQTILLAVSKDSNNNLVLLAYAIVSGENAMNWYWFLQKILRDFPGMEIFLSDYDKGVEQQDFQRLLQTNGIAFARCVRHMLANAGTNLKKAVSELTKSKIYMAARARTEEQYNQAMSDMMATDPRVAEWFAQRIHQWATVHFLSMGKSRCGNLLNNMAEQYNSVILQLRHLPILDFCIKIQMYQCQQYTTRHYQSMDWLRAGYELVKYKRDYHYQLVDEASKHNCQQRPSNHPIYHGVVSSDLFEDSARTIDVTINLETLQSSCICKRREEYKEPCRHEWCTLLKLQPSPEASLDFEKVLNWYVRVYSCESYHLAYGAMLPHFGLNGSLKVVALVPPEQNRSKGRPKKTRYVSQAEKPQFCKSCGNSGHSQRTCANPKTEIRWNNYKKQAFAYASEVCKNYSYL